MGIPFYFYYICRKYKSQSIVFDNCEKSPDFLYFDYNSLIHPCINTVLENITEQELQNLNENELETTFINKCLEYTEDIVTKVNPKEKVIIVIDGVAPRAKMNQQRERRYKSVFLSEKKWDTNQITPGTPFMCKLNQRLSVLAKNSNGKIIVSDSTEHGEGEHKIMKMITENNDLSKIHCIYGLDADLIMLSLVNTKRKRILLFRDNSKFDEAHCNRFQYLSINLLSQFLVYDITSYTNFTDNEIVHNFSNFIVDYIFLCFMFGNDFLPHLSCLSIKNSGVDHMMRAYTNTLNKINPMYLTSFLINYKNITKYEDFSIKNIVNLSFLVEVLKQLTVLKEIHNTRFLDQLPEKENVVFYKDNYVNENTNYLEDNTKQKINKKKQVSVKQRYYTYYALNVSDSVVNYLEGMMWVLGYYLNHTHENWRWYYRYEVAPLLSDIIHLLQIHGKYKISNIRINKTNPYTEQEQLLLVLPLKSLENIKKKVDWLNILDQLKNTNEFKEYFPETLFLDCLNVEYLWQARPIFKNIPDTFLSTITTLIN